MQRRYDICCNFGGTFIKPSIMTLCSKLESISSTCSVNISVEIMSTSFYTRYRTCPANVCGSDACRCDVNSRLKEYKEVSNNSGHNCHVFFLKDKIIHNPHISVLEEVVMRGSCMNISFLRRTVILVFRIYWRDILCMHCIAPGFF